MSIQPTILLNAFLVAVVAVYFLRPVAWRLGFIDVPGGRKRHEQATPTCGGLAIVLAMSAAAVLGAFSASAAACAWVLLATCIGAADDLRGVPAKGRLLGYALAALLLFVPGDVGGLNLGDLAVISDRFMPAASLVIGFGLALALVNSVNLIDGLDGLAGGVSLAALFWLCVIAHAFGATGIAGDAEIAMAATAGFLVFNLRHAWQRRASVFLGDAGSAALGATLAVLVLGLAANEGGPTLSALLWLVAVPIIDMSSLIVRRIAAGRSPFSADRCHIHHLTLDLGLSPERASMAITAAAFVCGGIGYIGAIHGVSAAAMLAGLVLPAAAHTALVALAARLGARRLRLASWASRTPSPASRQAADLSR